MTNDKNLLRPNQSVEKKVQRPDDQGNIVISGFVRITDPKTKEIIIEVRE